MYKLIISVGGGGEVGCPPCVHPLDFELSEHLLGKNKTEMNDHQGPASTGKIIFWDNSGDIGTVMNGTFNMVTTPVGSFHIIYSSY